MRKIVSKVLIITTMLVIMCSTVFANPKVIVDYYWGINCHFCKQIEPFIDQLEDKYKDKVEFKRHEVQLDQTNMKRFEQRFLKYHPNTKGMGTPTVEVNGKKMIIGLTNIQDELEADIQAAIEAKEAANIPEPSVDNEANRNFSLDSSTIKAISGAAIADSINPCAMLVLIILLSSLVVYNKGGKKKAILITVSFIFAVYITYFIIGLGLTHLLAYLNIGEPLIYAVGVIAIIVGIINIKDSIAPKTSISLEIPQKWRDKLLAVIRKATSPAGAFLSGILVTMFELPCTGGPYLFGTTLISSVPDVLTRILLLLLYNAVFILPLVVLAALIIVGAISVEQAEQMRNKHAKTLHAVIGVLMIILGVWIMCN